MSGYGSTDTCAGCRAFPLRESMDTAGRAFCPDLEEQRQWDWPACVLHMPASDRRERAALVRQLTQQKDGA